MGKKEDKEKVATAVLSITAKQEKKEEKKEEATFEILQNPCRVVRPQLNVIAMEEANKFKATKDFSIGGIIMVKRIDGGDENEAIVEPVTIKKALVESEDEPEPPEPFEYTE